MSYEPTQWKAGDIVTSTKLNKIEQGIATNEKILIADFNSDNGTLNKTWQEFYDSDISFIREVSSEGRIIIPVTAIGQIDNSYFIDTPPIAGNPEGFVANSPNDYPVSIPPDQGNAV